MNFGCPVPEGHPQGRRLGPAGAPGPAASHRPVRGRGRRRRAGHREVPHGRPRRAPHPPRDRPHRRGGGRGRRGAPRPHRRAALQRRGPLGGHRRAQGRTSPRSPSSATATSGRPTTPSTWWRQTGCDGVVVGRGCLGRPWLFRDLADAFAGRPVQPPPPLGVVAAVMRDHAERLAEWKGEPDGHEGLPQARQLVPHRLPGRRPAPEAGRPGRHPGRPRCGDRRARPRPSRSCPTRSEPPVGTPTAPARCTSPRAGSTSSTTPPHPRAPSCTDAPSGWPSLAPRSPASLGESTGGSGAAQTPRAPGQAPDPTSLGSHGVPTGVSDG